MQHTHEKMAKEKEEEERPVKKKEKRTGLAGQRTGRSLPAWLTCFRAVLWLTSNDSNERVLKISLSSLTPPLWMERF